MVGTLCWVRPSRTLTFWLANVSNVQREPLSSPKESLSLAPKMNAKQDALDDPFPKSPRCPVPIPKGVNPASTMFVGVGRPAARNGCTETSLKAMRPRASCRCTPPSPGNRRYRVTLSAGLRCQGWITALIFARCLWDAATCLGDLEVLALDLMTTSFFQLEDKRVEPKDIQLYVESHLVDS